MNCRYSSVHFVDVEALRSSSSMPMEPTQFEATVRQHCAHARDILQNQ